MLKVKYYFNFLKKEVKKWDQNVYRAKIFLYWESNLKNWGLVPL